MGGQVEVRTEAAKTLAKTRYASRIWHVERNGSGRPGRDNQMTGINALSKGLRDAVSGLGSE
jgi:hypothetical protein